MRTFTDERDPLQTITESQLQSEYNSLHDTGELDLEITFEQYIRNCTDNNGTLTEIK